MTTFYPMQFKPIFKQRIWGGQKLREVLHKEIPQGEIGESWELSAVAGDVSVVANGAFAGQPLDKLIEAHPEEVLGTAVHAKFGNEFPLLFKFIDARQDLSIQVHPSDALAKKRHNSFGKTEMWYVMQADPASRIIVGFNHDSSPAEFMKNLDAKTLPSILDQAEARPGDMFFLATGTIHAIGAGIMVAEIQQTSDITYRVYDWDRVDANGKPRELHLDQAIDAMNYNVVHARKSYEKRPNTVNAAVDCDYFRTSFLPLDGNLDIEKDGASFTVYMCVEGAGDIEIPSGATHFEAGDTILMPAALTKYALSGKASLLEVVVP
jgi:mannose-6-phosphate isomerase